MTRARPIFRCGECGATAPRWTGRCGTCGQWSSLVEELVVGAGSAAGRGSARRPGTTGRPAEGPIPLAEVDADGAAPRPTGVGELDRVLSGGLVPGSVTLVGGEPGIGKSTLLLQAATRMADGGLSCLLVCAEESVPQVKRRALRLGTLPAGVWVVSETSMAGILAAVDSLDPDVLVVDSIQTVADPEVESSPGSMGQVRACAARVVEASKSRGMATVLVGHVTKDGALAGPRVLEHLVDTVLTFEGERHHALRLLRAVKHRFGPTGELGLFEMTDGGLQDVPDPGRLFLGDRRAEASGSAVFPAMEGHRPVLVEIQALVTRCEPPVPRRSASGLDAGRLALLAAVLDERAGYKVGHRELYASAVGGVRVAEPGADLATILALASAARGIPLPPDLVACGEIGLAGEVRQVAHTQRRLVEAARLGFHRAVVAQSTDIPDCPLSLIPVGSVVEALSKLGLPAAPPGQPEPPPSRPNLRPPGPEPRAWPVATGTAAR
ncbi:MAG: DNA repair protein RadA [Acidimicrobiales bacterium]